MIEQPTREQVAQAREYIKASLAADWRYAVMQGRAYQGPAAADYKRAVAKVARWIAEISAHRTTPP